MGARTVRAGLIFLFLFFTKNIYTKQKHNYDNLTFVSYQNMIAALQLFSQHKISKARKPINLVKKRQQKKLNILHNN